MPANGLNCDLYDLPAQQKIKKPSWKTRRFEI